jgi:hypothetical protein
MELRPGRPELPILALQRLCLVREAGMLRLSLPRPARRDGSVQDEAGRQERRADDRDRLPADRPGKEDREDRDRAADPEDQL